MPLPITPTSSRGLIPRLFSRRWAQTVVACLQQLCTCRRHHWRWSTFVFRFFPSGREYSAKTGTKLDYQPIGSGQGIVQIKASAVDFGASDLVERRISKSDLEIAAGHRWHRAVVNIEGELARTVRCLALSGAKRRLASRTRQIYLQKPAYSVVLLSTTVASPPEMPLAPNAVRLDIQASSLLFTGLGFDDGDARGVSCRRLRNSASNRRRWQGSELAGVYSSASVSGRRGYLATRVCRRPSTHPRRALP